MNHNSSRSHAVLTISLGQEHVHTGCSKKSKFCLVDLAGSEKVGKTQAKGIRLKEATLINKSLTTLGTCMNKLAENMKSSDGFQRHIPFRESVLTRLLSDSLGGNCKTTLIVTTSPCSYNVEETISTLRFGERAKKIKTKARINQIKTSQQYRKELHTAQTEIMKLYRIIEDCAADICTAFKGTLNVETCKSYKALLGLKKHTLSLINGDDQPCKTQGSGLLANILPDLTHLRSLKKVPAIRKQQKHLFPQNNSSTNVFTPRGAAPPPPAFAQQISIHTPHSVMVQGEPPNSLRERTASLERSSSKKKLPHDPLKKKKDFKVNTSTQNQLDPPDWSSSMFQIPSDLKERLNQTHTGLSLHGMYHSNAEDSEFSDYNSEYDGAQGHHLPIVSPACSMMSDASAFCYSETEQEEEYTDFNEDQLPKNFFEMSKEERIVFAKEKKVDPMLVEYRYEIQKEIDWKAWNSDDEENKAIDCEAVMHRFQLEKHMDHLQQRFMMLGRLTRMKAQEYSSRIDIDGTKHKTLAKKYRAKTEENNKLMTQNTNLEKMFERAENEKMNAIKDNKILKREHTESKKKIHKLQKQLDSKQNELKIEKQAQINLSSRSASMWRKKIHQKYGAQYAKKIDKEVIRNNAKDIKLRFNELAKAFKSQSSKYQDLEQVIETTKGQMAKYEELMRQKEVEEHELRDELENEDQTKKELILQHNLEIQAIRKTVTKTKNKADMWKRRAFVYKNAVNTLMEEGLEDDENDDEEDTEDEVADEDTKKVNMNVMARKKLKPLESLSPRSMQRGLDSAEQEGNDSTKPRYGGRSRQSDDGKLQLHNKKKRRHKYDRYMSPTRNDPFHMTPSQKASLTSVKMKIRGGGSDDDMYHTPIKTSKNISKTTKKISKRVSGGTYKKGSLSRKTPPSHKRQTSQPLNGSLSVPQNTNYGSSDDYINNPSNNKSRSPIPIGNIDALLRTKSREAPSLYHISQVKKSSPRPPGTASYKKKKKSSSPIPPLPSQVMVTNAEEEESQSDSNSFDVQRSVLLLRNSGEYTSPAGSFFSRIKHVDCYDDEEDDDSKSKTIQHKRKRRVAVSMPEPCSDDASGYDDAETPYISDDSNRITTDEDYDESESPPPQYDQRRSAQLEKRSRWSSQNVYD
eukprot:111121_1